VEWQPIMGTLPPLTADAWERVFTLYQRTPEYQKVNFGMSLQEFKGIFWWEYGHRLLGRLIGLAFLIPGLYFLVRRRIDARLGWKLAGVFALGGLQGAVGWYMVKSGLVDDPRVSHLRLTAHLGLALLIHAAMLWLALDLLRPRSRQAAPPTPRLATAAGALALLVFAMALTGGLVAGTRAGFAYNTFPLMNGRLFPPEILMLDPWWLNLVDNMATVQWVHRMMAWLLIASVIALWVGARQALLPRAARWSVLALMAAVALQVALGIATLLLVVPVPLAAAHQAGAVLVFTAALVAAHELRRDNVRQAYDLRAMRVRGTARSQAIPAA
jgi:cytochrome c oxidase assembly protein subunit 15